MSKLSKTTVSFLFFLSHHGKGNIFSIFFLKPDTNFGFFALFITNFSFSKLKKKKKKRKNTNNVKFLDSCQGLLFLLASFQNGSLTHFYFSVLLLPSG